MTTLYIRDKAGTYSPATPKTIISESARLAKSMIKGRDLTSPKKAEAYLIPLLAHLEHEVFGCIYLDNQHHVIEWCELFRGTIDGANVYPREVVKQALALNAAAVIFAHNHPSGLAEPSDADIALTRKLKDALALVDIKVLDHLIIGHGAVYSFAEKGTLFI